MTQFYMQIGDGPQCYLVRGQKGRKRCMTQLDDEALKALTEERIAEQRTESLMIAILVKEALAVRAARRIKARA